MKFLWLIHLAWIIQPSSTKLIKLVNIHSNFERQLFKFSHFDLKLCTVNLACEVDFYGFQFAPNPMQRRALYCSNCKILWAYMLQLSQKYETHEIVYSFPNPGPLSTQCKVFAHTWVTARYWAYILQPSQTYGILCICTNIAWYLVSAIHSIILAIIAIIIPLEMSWCTSEQRDLRICIPSKLRFICINTYYKYML